MNRRRAILTAVPLAVAPTWTGIFDTSWNHGFNWFGFTSSNSATAAATFGNAVFGPINIDTSAANQVRDGRFEERLELATGELLGRTQRLAGEGGK